MLAGQPHGEEILELVQEKQRMLKDAWLTYTGHKRPGMKKGLPVAEAQAKAAALDKRIATLAGPDSAAEPAPHILRIDRGPLSRPSDPVTSLD